MPDPSDPVVARGVNRLPRRQRARWAESVVQLMARRRERSNAEAVAYRMELEMGEGEAMLGLNRDDEEPSAPDEQ